MIFYTGQIVNVVYLSLPVESLLFVVLQPMGNSQAPVTSSGISVAALQQVGERAQHVQ